MPNFLYTLVLADIAVLGVGLKILFTVPPESGSTILGLLFIIGVWVFLTTSLILFFINKSRSPSFSNYRIIYRRGLRLSIIIALGTTGFLFLKSFGLLNLINGGLLALLIIFIIGINPSRKG